MIQLLLSCTSKRKLARYFISYISNKAKVTCKFSKEFSVLFFFILGPAFWYVTVMICYSNKFYSRKPDMRIDRLEKRAPNYCWIPANSKKNKKRNKISRPGSFRVAAKLANHYTKPHPLLNKLLISSLSNFKCFF